MTRMGDTLLATSKLESWKAHDETKHWSQWQLWYANTWTALLCHLYASFLQFGKKLTTFLPFDAKFCTRAHST
jgi:hypothetical protein